MVIPPRLHVPTDSTNAHARAIALAVLRRQRSGKRNRGEAEPESCRAKFRIGEVWGRWADAVSGTLTPEKLNAAVALINRSVGIIGKHQIHGDALSWFGRHVAVSVTSDGSNISIQIEERFHNTTRGQLVLAAGLSVPGGFATLVALANMAMEPLGLLLGLTMPAFAYVAARAMHGRRITSTEQQLEGLGDQLAALLGD